MFYSLVFNRRRRRAEKELQEKGSEKLKRKPSVASQPEGSLVNDNDSEIVTKPKVCFPDLHVQSWECLYGLSSLLIAGIF